MMGLREARRPARRQRRRRLGVPVDKTARIALDLFSLHQSPPLSLTETLDTREPPAPLRASALKPGSGAVVERRVRYCEWPHYQSFTRDRV